MTKHTNQPFLAVAAGAVIVTLSGVAAAQSSSTVSSSYGTGLNEAAATQLINATTLQQMLVISNAVGARSGAFRAPAGATADSGQRFGMAAGNADNWNVWGSLAGDNNRYVGGLNTTGTRTNFNADTRNTVLGADYALSSTVALGVSAAFDHITGSLEAFNGAGVSLGAPTNLTSSGYTVAPYLGWQINKDWSLDASIGWGDTDWKQSNINVSGKADRFFYGTNLNYTAWYGNWQVLGKGSYLYGEERYGNTRNDITGTSVGNTGGKNKLDQWRLGGQAGYWLNGVLPYVGLAYSNDSRSVAIPTGGLNNTDDLGKNAWTWTLGVNLVSLKNSLTGGLVYSREKGRSHSERDNLMANINYRF